MFENLFKMANVIITLKIMPESPETDLDQLAEEAKSYISSFAGAGDMRMEQEPVAFGLKALKLTFVMDESKGSTEELENQISKIGGVNSVEVVDVRRAVG